MPLASGPRSAISSIASTGRGSSTGAHRRRGARRRRRRRGAATAGGAAERRWRRGAGVAGSAAAVRRAGSPRRRGERRATGGGSSARRERRRRCRRRPHRSGIPRVPMRMTSARDEPVRSLHALAIHEHAVRARSRAPRSRCPPGAISACLRDTSFCADHDVAATRRGRSTMPAVGHRVFLSVDERDEPAARRRGRARGAGALGARERRDRRSALTNCVAPPFASSA